jgi:hypothetical protein
MKQMMVELVWQKEILASASFREIQFWTLFLEESFGELKCGIWR